jgi:DtxR family transcriptional regulator, Mn-dependent transcriptional regulator
MSTISEENYIKAIFKISHEMNTEVTTSSLSEYLTTKASSVTDMVQKLANKSLVNYIKYQGVTLTPEGERIAVKIVRKHRLWELFLYQTLGFKWDEIHEIAEELEHIKSDMLIEKLDKFLEYPKKDPHGDPIPDVNGLFPETGSVPLGKLGKGARATVVGVHDKSSAFLAYLDKIDIKLGSEIEVTDCHGFDNSMDIRMNDSVTVHLSYQAAINILIIEK